MLLKFDLKPFKELFKINKFHIPRCSKYFKPQLKCVSINNLNLFKIQRQNLLKQRISNKFIFEKFKENTFKQFTSHTPHNPRWLKNSSKISQHTLHN